jgi:hypothetical protein
MKNGYMSVAITRRNYWREGCPLNSIYRSSILCDVTDIPRRRLA